MLDRIEYQLYLLALNILSTLYVFTYYFGIILSFFSGLIMPILHFNKPEQSDQDTVLRRLFIALACLLFIFGTISNWSVPALIDLTKTLYGVSPQAVHYPISQWLLIPVFIAGIVSHIYLRRTYTPMLNQLKLRFTKRTKAERETRTDVRSVKELLPETTVYDPQQYIDLKKGIFVGLDTQRNPQYIPTEKFRKQHADIIGTTGAGKGVASGLILYQLIKADEGVFVLDPKDDEFAPHLMRKACEDAGKPFYLIDLRKGIPQLDLLAGATPDHIEELLVAGFSFAEKGDMADFYRIDDRKAARKAPLEASDDERKTLRGIFNSKYVQGLENTVKGFFGKMEEMSFVEAINAKGGLDLRTIFDNGGCCYIIGSTRNSKILIAQKMLLIRLFQIAETRDRVNTTPKPIAIFLDELKYHISKPAMEGLGVARDKGVHLLLAHQSVSDLHECPADLNGDAVVGAVVENTKFKLVYKLQDPETAEWIAKMSGTILVDDETRYIETDASLSEVVESKRNIRQAERQYVDTNMLLNLPPFVSYIFTESDTPKPSLISPIKVTKSELQVHQISPTDNATNVTSVHQQEAEQDIDVIEPESNSSLRQHIQEASSQDSESQEDTTSENSSLNTEKTTPTIHSEKKGLGLTKHSGSNEPHHQNDDMTSTLSNTTLDSSTKEATNNNTKEQTARRSGDQTKSPLSEEDMIKKFNQSMKEFDDADTL